MPILEYNRGHFCLKAAILGSGPMALVLGSHRYYPRTFSKKRSTSLQWVCADTRGFVPNHPKQTEADFSLDHIIQDIEALRILLKNDHVILVGHSIHAFMALEYARQFPGHGTSCFGGQQSHSRTRNL